MKYAIDVHEMVFPKYAKIQFKINKGGNLTVAASPSFTPGQLPEGTKGGKVPKGTRVFDYDKQIITSLGIPDIIKLIDMSKKKVATENVDIFRNSEKYNKKITFSYNLDESTGAVKFLTIYFHSTDYTGKEIKFYLPISLANFEEIAHILQSYLSSVCSIKLFCLAETDDSESNNYNSKD